MDISLQTLSLLIAMFASVSVGIYATLTNKKSFMHRVFGMLALGLSIWGVSIALLYLTQTNQFFFCTLIFMSGAIWFFCLLLFAYSFPANKIPPRQFYLLSIPAFLIFILSPFRLFVSGFTTNAKGYLEPINNMYFFIPFIGVFLGYVIYSGILIFQNYKNYKNIFRYRMQFRYLFTGLSIFVASIILFDTILPALGVYSLNILGPDAGVIFFACTGYAIAKHSLLDIRIVIQRGLIYLFLFGLSVGAYITMIQLMGYFLHRITNTSIISSAGLVMLLGVVFFRPLENYFRKVTDPVFFKNRYDYPDALHKLSKILHTNVNRSDIVTNSSNLLKELFKTEWVVFRLLPEDQNLSPLQAALAVKINFEGTQIGVLELGPKKSGDGYTPDDMKLLETFAYQAAVALEKGRLYEKVEEYNLHLEQLVEERTSDVKKLQEDQKQTMIDISHNLQTPLAIIKGEMELLSGTPMYTKKIENVKRSMRQISLFIRQLLHLSKLDHSAFDVVLSRVDLSRLLLDQAEYFEVMAAQKKVRIHTSIEKGVFVIGNEKLLSELMINLISNSLKYRRKRHRDSSVTISLEKGEKGIELMVSDNGIGIGAEDLGNIFTRFYQSSRKPNTFGVGLGLAISKKIIERHGGSIRAESILGEGTSILVLFPLADTKK